MAKKKIKRTKKRPNPKLYSSDKKEVSKLDVHASGSQTGASNFTTNVDVVSDLETRGLPFINTGDAKIIGSQVGSSMPTPTVNVSIRGSQTLPSTLTTTADVDIAEESDVNVDIRSSQTLATSL